MYLALTGFRLKGRDVLKAGVATHFVQSNKLPELESTLLGLENARAHDVGEVLDNFQQMVGIQRFLTFCKTFKEFYSFIKQNHIYM